MSHALSVFITGTDTEIGKTTVSSALLHGLVAAGWRAAALKPIAAGAQWRDGAWHNDDADALAAAANVALPPEVSTPYLLREPAAPHIVAAHEGVVLDLAHIVACHASACRAADIVVVEGVGGFCVPLNAEQDTADLAVALRLPVVLVVGIRLGCLNHALLSAEAIAARGLTLAGWVANRVTPDMAFAADNIATLQARLAARYNAPLVGVVPYLQPASPEKAAACLDLELLLRALRGARTDRGTT